MCFFQTFHQFDSKTWSTWIGRRICLTVWLMVFSAQILCNFATKWDKNQTENCELYNLSENFHLVALQSTHSRNSVGSLGWKTKQSNEVSWFDVKTCENYARVDHNHFWNHHISDFLAIFFDFFQVWRSKYYHLLPFFNNICYWMMIKNSDQSYVVWQAFRPH